MTSLWFIVPAAGRLSLARVCLRQLRRTCDALAAEGVEASAVVVAHDANLRIADSLGFATVRSEPYHFLTRKFNDGIHLACDPQFNPYPVDYVVPCGSDDWVDYRLFLELPPADTVYCCRWAGFVKEDGTEMVSRRLDYDGGVGIRVYPRELVSTGDTLWDPFRPADQDRKRGFDTSMLINVTRTSRPKIVYREIHEYQVVDWKTEGEQLNTYADILGRHRRGGLPVDPFEALVGLFPDRALAEMRAHYRQSALVAA